MSKNIFNTSFIDDEEKMRDFHYLSKDEFLQSYSYLNEEEYEETRKDAILNIIDKINSSEELVRKFVSRKYGEGWIEEWDVNLDNNSKVRSFIDKNNCCFKVKYMKNENNMFLPYRIIQAELLPKPPIQKKKFRLPVTWEMYGIVEVEAESLNEAVDYFNENSDSISLPKEMHYVDASFNLSCDEISYLELFQK